MKYLLLCLLAGCSTFDSNDFCTLFVDNRGVTSCVAWEFGPSKTQAANYSGKWRGQ